jgi:hypothetical protein
MNKRRPSSLLRLWIFLQFFWKNAKKSSIKGLQVHEPQGVQTLERFPDWHMADPIMPGQNAFQQPFTRLCRER